MCIVSLFSLKIMVEFAIRDLSSSGLTGEISEELASLKMLDTLDLSNNSLNGAVPDFLTQLPLLRVLNLERNNLSGLIPSQLIEKFEDGSLTLRYEIHSFFLILNFLFYFFFYSAEKYFSCNNFFGARKLLGAVGYVFEKEGFDRVKVLFYVLKKKKNIYIHIYIC
ncbi:hypothetical protein IC582_008085 [Cucumis melo]